MKKDLDLLLRKEVLQVIKEYEDEIKCLNINYIGYREFYRDGTSMAFCSNLNWYDIAPYSEEMKVDMAIHYALELIFLKKNEFNYIVRTTSFIKNKFIKSLSSQDMCNSLLIYKKEKDIIKMYSFIASKNNKEAMNYFVNKKDYYDYVVSLYQEKLFNIFKKKEYNELRLPLFNKETTEIIFKNETIKNQEFNFTKREKDCLHLLMYGASNKEIAKNLNISPNTAAYHVNNIKNKLQVNSRYSIVKLINKKLR